MKTSAADYERLLLVRAAALLVAAGTLVRSAAVVDNYDKQQALMTSEEISEVVNGGCDDGRVANCRTLPLFNYTEITPPSPAPDAAGDILRDDNCPSKNLERHLRCVDVFTRRCLTNDQRRAFYSLYSVPTLDMQELCTENGPYREEYLKHAACLRTVHSEYLQCGRKHQRELSALMDHNRLQNGSEATTAAPLTTSPEQITQNLIHLCGSFRGHLQCVHGLVRDTCGPQTEAFASQFLSQMASSLLNICEKYGVGGNNLYDGDVGDVSRSPASGASRAASGAGAAALIAAAVHLTASWHW